MGSNDPFMGEEAPAPRRTFLLWFLAICSMLNAGMCILAFSFYMLFPDLLQQSVAVMEEMPTFNDPQYREVFDMYLSIKGWQYGLLIISEAAIFAGALIMLWKLKPLGFHLYTCGQIALICVQNFLIGGRMTADWSSILWTVTLIILYALQLRFMQPDDSSFPPSEEAEEDSAIDNFDHEDFDNEQS